MLLVEKAHNSGAYHSREGGCKVRGHMPLDDSFDWFAGDS